MQNNSLFNTLKELNGNTKACVYTDILWGIPSNLYQPFIAVYMFAFSITDYQIGIIVTVGMFFQVFTGLLGGVISDKIGRRRAIAFFDVFAWVIPSLLWAFAQNIWWFIIAAVLNSLGQITNIAWTCLLVEDCEKEKLVNVFSLIQVTGLLAVFFAPISAVLVSKYQLVPVVRWLYIIMAVCMAAKTILLYKFSSETKVGTARISETRGVSILKLILQYKDIFIKMVTTKKILLVLLIFVLSGIWVIPTNNFFGLYVTENLHIDSSFLAVFPMIRAAVMLGVFFTFQGYLNAFPFKKVMLTGIALYIISHLFLIFAPAGNLWILVIYTLLEVFGIVLVMPRKDSMAMWFVDENERARMMSVMHVCVIALASPFGLLIGFISSVNRIFPFILNIAVFLFAGFIILISNHKNGGQYESD